MASTRCNSPCGYFCQFNQQKSVCLGCFRSPEDIKNWIQLTEPQKKEVMLAANKRMAAYTTLNVYPANFDFPVYWAEE